MKMEEVDNKPINLGVENVDENINKILSKPPGYSLFKCIKQNDVEIDIEETLLSFSSQFACCAHPYLNKHKSNFKN